jgi:hypothetical protein
MRSMGLDLGATKVAYCVIEDGHIQQRGTVSSVEELVGVLGPGTSPARVAFEACREAWHVHATVTDWGQQAKLIDTTRVRRIGVGQHGRKSDRLDAEAIAWAVERGQLPEAHVLSPARQKLRTEVLTRRALVESRTQMVTTVRGIVRSQGLRLPSCDPDGFVAMVRRRQLPESIQAMVEPLLVVLSVTQQQLCSMDERLETLCAREPAISRLTTVPGVGLIVAAMHGRAPTTSTRHALAGEGPSLATCPCHIGVGFPSSGPRAWTFTSCLWAMPLAPETRRPSRALVSAFVSRLFHNAPHRGLCRRGPRKRAHVPRRGERSPCRARCRCAGARPRHARQPAAEAAS